MRMIQTNSPDASIRLLGSMAVVIGEAVEALSDGLVNFSGSVFVVEVAS